MKKMPLKVRFKISLKMDGETRKARLPFMDADHCVVNGDCPCGVTPFKVAGAGRRFSEDDRAYEADGVALCCDKYVGVIRVETGTLFGVREDEAVSRCGARIY